MVIAAGLFAAGCGPEGRTGDPSDITKPGDDPKKDDPTKDDPKKDDPIAKFEVLDLEPDEGRTFGGELVVLEGNAFVPGTEVYFGSLKAPDVIVYSAVIIHARTPAHKPGIVDITLEAPNGAKTVLEDAFLFRDKLSVTSIEPNRGPAGGGTPITVRGVGFTQDTKLLLDGRLAIDITVVDSTSLLAITPPGDGGDTDVIVSTPWTNDVIFGGFRFTVAPSVSSVSPLSGPVDGESIVTLTGAGLSADAIVYVDDAPVETLSGDGAGTLTISLPGGDEGAADIQVSTQDGHTLLNDAFTFVGAGSGETEILNVWPHAGDVSGGSQVTLTAYGLTNSGDTTVTFGNKTAQVVSVDAISSRIIVLAPNGAPGTADITLTTSNGADTVDAGYQYTTIPAPVSVLPANGFVDGGETVTLSGANLAGDIEVYVGALPATIVSQTATKIELITPIGSPGWADIRVVGDGGEGVLEDGFTYKPMNGVELYAVAPNYGAIAGNTLIHVYGAGFKKGAEVRFAKQFLSKVDVVSSTELQVRAPKADEPTNVDVAVEQDGKTMELLDAYSYFDPYSPYGGSWGPIIRGSVNVTVLDIFTTDPIPGAFVMLWANAETPYQGVTDDRGQITFSGEDLRGAQMVTASKAQHTAMTVVEYDAENVTVHLIPMNPSSSGGGGGGGEGLPFGHITGSVTGLGKYIIMPPVTCDAIEAQGLAGAGGTNNCLPCETDADCGENASCAGTYCAEACLSSQDCPTGYVCGGTTENKLGCIPYPGEKAAYCQTTNHTLWEEPPTPHTPIATDDGSRAWVDGVGEYWMKTRLGELAVICIGGVVRDPNNKTASFLPLRMGVARNVEPIPGEELSDINIELNIPLKKDVPLRLDGAPLMYKSQPTGTTLRIAMDFGPEGYWNVAQLQGIGQNRFTLDNQPEALGGELEGVTYIFHAEVRGGEFGVSGTQAFNVKLLEVDRLFSFQDGAWTVQNAGIQTDILGMWGNAPQNVWAVGADGLIAHGKNGAWFPQYSPVSDHLRAVWGIEESYALTVGDNGAAVEFDGVKWSALDTGAEADLFGVWGTSPDNMYAVGEQVVLHRGSDGWTSIASAPSVTLRAAWGAGPTDLMTVGDDGRLWRYNALDAAWKTEQLVTGLALRGISGTAPDHVWIVGDKGTVIEWSGPGQWIQHDVPTTEQLNAVVALENGQVFVSGSRGLLLRYDGNGWSAEKAPKYGGDLMAVVAFDEPGTPSYAAGTQVVTLGPMLSFPEIIDPISNFGTFGYHLAWTAEPSALPTFNFVQMLAGPGFYFPAWWTVVESEVTEVTFPNLPEISPGVSPLAPFAGGPILMQVNRVFKPGASVHNFDFWDMYDVGSWKSWATNGVTFTPL